MSSIPARSSALTGLPMRCALVVFSFGLGISLWPAPTSDAQGASAAAKATSAAPSTAPAVQVTTVVVEPSTLTEEVLVTGELRANEQVELRAEASGRVVDLAFDEGQRVRKGTLLVKINDADLRAELRRVGVERQLASQREQRTKVLLEEQTVSQQLYDEALGQVQVIDARLEEIEAEIAKTEVRAPFAGVIGLRTVSEGSYLTPAQAVATLQSLDPIKLDFSIPEKYASQVKAGDTVDFSVVGVAGSSSGRVYAVEPRVDAATRTVQVRARAENSDRRLLPGAFAKVQLVLGARSDALMVPAIALVPGLESTTVYVVEDGNVHVRPVRVGTRTSDEVLVLEGLEPGDRVVVSGIQQVRPGVKVEERRKP